MERVLSRIQKKFNKSFYPDRLSLKNELKELKENDTQSQSTTSILEYKHPEFGMCNVCKAEQHHDSSGIITILYKRRIKKTVYFFKHLLSYVNVPFCCSDNLSIVISHFENIPTMWV